MKKPKLVVFLFCFFAFILLQCNRIGTDQTEEASGSIARSPKLSDILPKVCVLSCRQSTSSIAFRQSG
jgi:hypothetical protein